jgi:hypothetical protein
VCFFFLFYGLAVHTTARFLLLSRLLLFGSLPFFLSSPFFDRGGEKANFISAVHRTGMRRPSSVFIALFFRSVRRCPSVQAGKGRRGRGGVLRQVHTQHRHTHKYRVLYKYPFGGRYTFFENTLPVSPSTATW